MANYKKKENKRRVITQEQAIELADKYLLFSNKIALRDNISVRKVIRGWEIMAITIPIIEGKETELMTFSIDMVTGEVGAGITNTIFSITNVLKEINERKDIDETKKEQLKTKVEEIKDSAKKPVNRNKMNVLKKWFEKNPPYLKSIIDLINTLLKWGKDN